ncbi:MAG: diaminopimelate epimerase [Arenicella sp.]
MKLPFTKMQGLGNDFVVLDFVRHPVSLSNSQFSHIADRRFGVGCDQILIVEPSDEDNIDFRYRIVNADGSEVGQCGNGARCLVKFVREQGLTDKTIVNVSTSTSDMTLQANDDGSVTVDMGKVSFDPASVPFIADAMQDMYPVEIDNNGQKQTIEIAIANIGNPHCLLLVDDIDTAEVDRIGPQIESHERFPEKVNVGFMQMISPNEIKLRVYERGAGETMACGSGACAAAAMGQNLGLLCDNVEVHLPGGPLHIQRTDNGNVLMTGAAEFSFTGEIQL